MIAQLSPRQASRIAGVLYLMDTAFGPGMLAVRKVFAAGDASATASNLLANEALFRIGYTGNLVAIATYIGVTALFYTLFKPVNKTLSLLAAFMSLTGCIVLVIGNVFYLAPLVTLQGEPSLALVSLKLYSQFFNLSFVFFGFYCLIIGYLIFNSGFLPRILGVGMMLAGMTWAVFIIPGLARVLFPTVMLAGVGEAALVVWLLAFGVNSERWRERDTASRLAI